MTSWCVKKRWINRSHWNLLPPTSSSRCLTRSHHHQACFLRNLARLSTEYRCFSSPHGYNILLLNTKTIPCDSQLYIYYLGIMNPFLFVCLPTFQNHLRSFKTGATFIPPSFCSKKTRTATLGGVTSWISAGGIGSLPGGVSEARLWIYEAMGLRYLRHCGGGGIGAGANPWRFDLRRIYPTLSGGEGRWGDDRKRSRWKWSF